MKQELQNFIESLREELKQYGELLALLDLEQEQVLRRLPDELLATVSAINAQGGTIEASRRERAQRQRDLALAVNLEAEAPIALLRPLLPETHRPLVTALVDENNQLLSRVRQRARQNHILLSRAMELMNQFLTSFCAIAVPTYSGNGTVAVQSNSGCALYQDVC